MLNLLTLDVYHTVFHANEVPSPRHVDNVQKVLTAIRTDGVEVHARIVELSSVTYSGNVLQHVSLDDVSQRDAVLLVEFVEPAPPSVTLRQDVSLHPAAATEVVEVLAGVDARVHVGQNVPGEFHTAIREAQRRNTG